MRRHPLFTTLPLLLAVGLCQVWVGPSALGGVTLTVTDPMPRYTHTVGNTTTTAIIPTVVTGAIHADFQAAFNSWNNSLPMASQWTLVNGGALNMAAKFDISIYRATTTGIVGDLEINVFYTPGAGDPPGIGNPNNIQPNEAVWSQSVFTNQKLMGSLPGNPYLDNTSPPMSQLGPPAYPFQYAGSVFYDDPSRPAYAFWYAIAYLSTANFTTRTLTVYEGISWGFTVATVPEPSTYLMGAIVVVVGVVSHRRLRRGKGPATTTTLSDAGRPTT